jgi:MbtH protein
MANPFDDPDGMFVVLINHEGQHSLWPDFVPSPDGWRTAHGPSPWEECRAYVERHWRDLRPLSLIAETGGSGSGAV